MARIRTIKPAFFQSITLAGLSLAAERHFAGLFTYADDEGRGQDEARLLKAALWPLRDEMTTPKVERLMVELAEASLITRYSVEGRCFFEINGWGEHQRINRPTPSKFPSCTEPSMTAHGALHDGSLGERKGKERKGTGKAAVAAEFAEFWKAYPKKVAKGAAERAWPKAREHAAAILADLARRKWGEPQFIPHPATYLNAQRWLDEPEVVAKPLSQADLDAAARREADLAAADRERLKRNGLLDAPPTPHRSLEAVLDSVVKAVRR